MIALLKSKSALASGKVMVAFTTRSKSKAAIMTTVMRGIGYLVRLGIGLSVIGLTAAVESASITTTVYVGRHFEIRDHDQPTKYVFDGATRVAAITGSLSSNKRLQRLRLWRGWDLISLAVTAADLVGQFQQNQPALVQALYQWNASTGGYEAINSGQIVSAGSVLWALAVTNEVCGILGSYSDPSGVHLLSGGEYVAGTGLEVWTPAFPTNSSAWAHDPQIDKWQSDLAAPLSQMSDLPLVLSPGEAGYVNAAVPIDLQIPDPTLRVRYYHEDHLGSSSVVTDQAGQLVEETSFYPFGAARHEFTPRQVEAPYQFTQKERDHESGLDYFEARYLMSVGARFISPDAAYAAPDGLTQEKLLGMLNNPQLHNLYSYAVDSPVRYRDPSGLDVIKLNEDQKAAVLQAKTQALAMLDYAINALQTGKGADARVKEFFGVKGLEQKQRLAQNLQRIRNDLADKGINEFSVSTSVVRGELAHVERGGNQRVFLTADFFDRSEWGLNSKPGLLLHEDSHLRSVLATIDLSESYQGALNLARRRNDSAFDNAKNYQYFVESVDADKVFEAVAAHPPQFQTSGESSASGSHGCELCKQSFLPELK